MNFEDDKLRKRSVQSFEPGSALVYRWGHYGVTYPAYQTMFDWYTSNLTLGPTDFVYKEVPSF